MSGCGPLLAFTLQEFLAKDIPPRQMLLVPCIAQQSVVMIHAERGIGKTYVALGIGFAVASGRTFLRWSAPEPRGVLYVDGEMSAIMMQERLRGTLASHDECLPVGQFRIITPDFQSSGMPNLILKEDQAALLDLITDDIELVILDNISTLVRGGEENTADDWEPVQEFVLALKVKGKSVLFIHHSGKGGGQRGTSKREDVADTVIRLKRPRQYSPSEGARFIVEYEKTRDFLREEAEPFEAHLVNGVWQVKLPEQKAYSKIVLLAKEGKKQHEIAEIVGVNKSTVSRHLGAAKEKGEL